MMAGLGMEVGESQGMAPLKPHAQAHLLSPTDKCKVQLSGSLAESSNAFCSGLQ